MAIFCGNLARGKTSTINGGGEQTRDYVYVTDVARANVLALEREAPSGAYNIGTGVETSVNRLYELLLEISAKDLPTSARLVQAGRAAPKLRRPCPGRTYLRLARANRHPHGPRRDPSLLRDPR